MNRLKTAVLLLVAFVAGSVADRAYHVLQHQQQRLAHVGVLVPNMDQAIAQWRALGYQDVQISATDVGVDRQYHGKPLDCVLKQAFLKGQPDIELLQPICDRPNPWSSELHERGMQLHHLAFYVADPDAEIERARSAGMTEIAEGKWKDGQPGYGEFFYVRKPDDALIIEYLSHTKP